MSMNTCYYSDCSEVHVFIALSSKNFPPELIRRIIDMTKTEYLIYRTINYRTMTFSPWMYNGSPISYFSA
jgi:hypothetical protein